MRISDWSSDVCSSDLVDAGYSFGGSWKPRLSLEFDRASGDRRGGRQGRFDTLFGMRRADLAPAGLYNALARTNIVRSEERSLGKECVSKGRSRCVPDL